MRSYGVYRASIIRLLAGDPGLELQTRDITSLALSSPAFSISQVWPEQDQWPQMFTNMIKDWQVENEMHLPWSIDPAIGEGKSRAEMVWSL
jgi:hypothetical protein